MISEIPNDGHVELSTIEHSAILDDTLDRLSILLEEKSSLFESTKANQSLWVTIPDDRLNQATEIKLKDALSYRIQLISELLETMFETAVWNCSKVEETNQMTLFDKRATSQARNASEFRRDHGMQIEHLQSLIYELKDRLMEEKYRAKIALRYAQRWQTNHISQWTEMCVQNEQIDTKNIKQYQMLIQQTELVHLTTMQTLREQSEQRQKDAHDWQERYWTETDRFERELRYRRSDLRAIQQRRRAIVQDYHRMKPIVDENHRLKLEKELSRERQKHEEEAIKKIQAWWRGIRTRFFSESKNRQPKTKSSKT